MVKVAVVGAHGRMGSESCRAIEAEDDLELVARIGRGDDIGTIEDTGAEVAVEFSTPDSVFDNSIACLERGIHVVIGATGLTDDQLNQLGEAAERKGIGVFVAPNFALGAVLMMRFSEQAARFFDRAEIVERHHDKKLDAPSGTSLRTAEMMRRARGHDEATEVAIHSLRLPGSVAHQEVIFGGTGETLTIRHDSLDRTSFMPGVVLAVRKVQGLRGLTVGLENLLDL